VLFVGIGGVIVPAPLIEFRYYTIPVYLIALHCGMGQDHELTKSLLVALIYVVTNVVTMYLFLYRPFQWAHEPGVQRFIW
jgi:alpha-1,2-glucosyltransferase